MENTPSGIPLLEFSNLRFAQIAIEFEELHQMVPMVKPREEHQMTRVNQCIARLVIISRTVTSEHDVNPFGATVFKDMRVESHHQLTIVLVEAIDIVKEHNTIS